MTFFWALFGDALMFAALGWFAGYGAIGPATGLRLGARQKMRLFGEVFAITFVLLGLFIWLDQLLGWVAQPPWAGQPPPHRMLAIGALLTVGFLYTRRRARVLHEPLDAAQPQTAVDAGSAQGAAKSGAQATLAGDETDGSDSDTRPRS